MPSYKQIPNLPLAINLAGNELLEGVQAGTSVRFTTSQVLDLLSSTGVNYVTRAPSLNLLDFMFGDTYVNNAFVRIQTALLEQNLRGIYVPGDRTYLLDPAKQEIQLVLDDVHVWGENNPVFYSTVMSQGHFQVLYARRVKVEGIHIILDPSVTRVEIPGSYAGDKSAARRAGIGYYDSESLVVKNVFVRNQNNGVCGRGKYLGATLDAWKALSPAQRILTPMDLTNADAATDHPDLPNSERRAQGFLQIEGLNTEHCDFGILYCAQENVSVYDCRSRDTTITQAHPHGVYAAGNIVYDSDPLSPTFNQIVTDKSNGKAKFSRIFDYDNTWDSSFKFRAHEQLTIEGAYSQSAGGGLSVTQCDNVRLDGLTVVDCGPGAKLVPDDADDDDISGHGFRTNSCRDGVFMNINIAVRLGPQPLVFPVYLADTGGKNQRRNTETGELYWSERNFYKNIHVQTNYSGQDQNRDYDADAFVPATAIVHEIFLVGTGGGESTSSVLENCSHADAWGHYLSEMFVLRSGSGHRIITPARKGAATLVRVHQDSTDNLVVIDPDLVESRTVLHDPPLLLGNDYTRVHVIRAIKGDNSAYLADFGPLDTGANVAETLNRAATIVASRGPGVIHLPAGDIPIGPYAPTQIAPDEGASIIMTTAMSNITWQGHSTVFKPISNKIEMFAINGASDTWFRGIKFDNSANGVLVNAGQEFGEPGSGVAGLGLNANSAIRQYRAVPYPDNTITAVSWAATDDGQVTFTTTSAHVIEFGRDFTISGMTPAAYNGVYAARTGTAGSTLVGDKRVNPGVATVLGKLVKGSIGGSVYVDDCEFVDVYCCFGYYGNKDDREQSVGTASLTNSRLTGCVMGLIPEQPVHVVVTGNRFLNGLNGIPLEGGRIPGHLLYTTNSGGAWPLTVVANSNYAHTCASAVLKMRKGQSQVAIGNTFYNVERGIDVFNSGSVEITGNTITLAPGKPSEDQSCIEISNCRGGDVGNNVLDRSGCYGPAIRVKVSDIDDEAVDLAGELPRNMNIHDNTIIDDGAGGTNPAFIWIHDATDCEVSHNIARHVHDVTTGSLVVRSIIAPVVEIRNGIRINAFGNKRRTAHVGNPTGSDRLVAVLENSVDCTVGYSQDDLHVAITDNTVIDENGSTKRIRTDGSVTETWTPTLSFVTNGNFAPTMTSSIGWIERCGEMVSVGCRVIFDCGVYAGASGALRLAFPYKADALGIPFVNTVGHHRNVVTAGDNLGVVINNNENFFQFRRNTASGPGVLLDAASFPSGATGIELGFETRFRIARMMPWDKVPGAETRALMAAGWVPTNDVVLHKVDNCIRQLKSFGLWTKILTMWGPNSLLNWKTPGAYTMVPVGAPTFVVDDYFKGSGLVTDYYETSLNLNTGGAGIYTQNSASMLVWSKTDFMGDNSTDMGGSADARVLCRQDNGAPAHRGNSAINIGGAEPFPDSLGSFGWSRTASNNIVSFHNGVINVTQTTNPSAAVTTTTLKIGRGVSTVPQGSPRQLAFAIVGGGLTATDITNLHTALAHYLS